MAPVEVSQSRYCRLLLSAKQLDDLISSQIIMMLDVCCLFFMNSIQSISKRVLHCRTINFIYSFKKSNIHINFCGTRGLVAGWSLVIIMVLGSKPS